MRSSVVGSILGESSEFHFVWKVYPNNEKDHINLELVRNGFTLDELGKLLIDLASTEEGDVCVYDVHLSGPDDLVARANSILKKGSVKEAIDIPGYGEDVDDDEFDSSGEIHDDEKLALAVIEKMPKSAHASFEYPGIIIATFSGHSVEFSKDLDSDEWVFSYYEHDDEDYSNPIMDDSISTNRVDELFSFVMSCARKFE